MYHLSIYSEAHYKHGSCESLTQTKQTKLVLKQTAKNLLVGFNFYLGARAQQLASRGWLLPCLPLAMRSMGL